MSPVINNGQTMLYGQCMFAKAWNSLLLWYDISKSKRYSGLRERKRTVQRIVNGKTLPSPVRTIDVATEVERCMCGIAVSKIDSGTIPESLL